MTSKVCTRNVLAGAAAYAAYVEIRRRLLRQAEKEGRRIGPRWMGTLAWKLASSWSDFVGVKMASESGDGLDELDPARRYLIVWHPHGFLAWSPFFILSNMAVRGHPHGREWFAMVAPALFKLPIVSEILMLVNGRTVSKDVVENLAAKGKSLAIQPGGVHEQIETRHDQEQAIFPANLGFIRLAIKHGMDLLPTYLFNENQMMRRVAGLDKLSHWIRQTTGFGLPFITARFGLPMCGLIPYPTDVHVRWGSPVHVGDPDPNPSEERVQEVFTQYLAALQHLFDRYAFECLPQEVAAKGLKIIRLDGKPLPPCQAQEPVLRPTVSSVPSFPSDPSSWDHTDAPSMQIPSRL